MNARELMAAADRLTGVHTGMNAQEIQDIFARGSHDGLTIRFLVDLLKQTKDSSIRADAKKRLSLLGGRLPHLKGTINQALAPEKIVYTRPPEPKAPKRSEGGFRLE